MWERQLSAFPLLCATGVRSEGVVTVPFPFSAAMGAKKKLLQIKEAFQMAQKPHQNHAKLVVGLKTSYDQVCSPSGRAGGWGGRGPAGLRGRGGRSGPALQRAGGSVAPENQR